jgi:hypothetical protein
MATPANSAYNELVIEAGRLSILNGGRGGLESGNVRSSARHLASPEAARRAAGAASRAAKDVGTQTSNQPA